MKVFFQKSQTFAYILSKRKLKRKFPKVHKSHNSPCVKYSTKQKKIPKVYKSHSSPCVKYSTKQDFFFKVCKSHGSPYDA
jgi:hypothetical protein